MIAPWAGALVAVFAWWFSTGAILWAVRRADARGAPARLACTLGALPVLGAGLWGVEASLGATGPNGALGGYLSALAIWGWIELAFLTGAITGPNRSPCPAHIPEWERFIRASGTIAYHEMLLVGMLAALWLHGHGAANTVAAWTFTVLFIARVSAKLNLYFGVPRINTEFLPSPLIHLESHFRVARFNRFFPVSVAALTVLTALWIGRLAVAETAGGATAHALLAAITALALIEHLVMVLPLPDAKLWRWMMPAPTPTEKPRRAEGPHGF